MSSSSSSSISLSVSIPSSSVSSESGAFELPTPTPRARFVLPPAAPDAAALAANPRTAPRSAAYSPRRCLRFWRPSPGARCAVPPFRNDENNRRLVPGNLKSKNPATHLDKRHVKDLDPCAFMPVAPPCTKESSPVIFRIATTSSFSSGAKITNVPLCRGHDLNLDPRVPAAPSRFVNLTPPQSAGMHRSGNDI